jgi:hypothetical protein
MITGIVAGRDLREGGEEQNADGRAYRVFFSGIPDYPHLSP